MKDFGISRVASAVLFAGMGCNAQPFDFTVTNGSGAVALVSASFQNSEWALEYIAINYSTSPTGTLSTKLQCTQTGVRVSNLRIYTARAQAAVIGAPVAILVRGVVNDLYTVLYVHELECLPATITVGGTTYEPTASALVVVEVGQIGRERSDPGHVLASSMTVALTQSGTPVNYSGSFFGTAWAEPFELLNDINALVSPGVFRGNAFAPGGPLLRIQFTGGISGPWIQDENYHNASIVARDVVQQVRGNFVYADIATTGTSGTEHVGEVSALTGDFRGSLTTRTLASGLNDVNQPVQGFIRCRHDLDADITLTGSLADSGGTNHEISLDPAGGGVFRAGRTIRIGNALANGASINLPPAASLQGNVIINTANAGGSWTGAVTVGGTALSPVPAYAQTSAALGGGAVGLVPFALHDSSCSPANTPTFPGELPMSALLHTNPDPGQWRDVILEFYGPVRVMSTTDEPVFIEQLSPSGQSWIDMTPYFGVNVRRGASDPVSRQVIVTAIETIPGGNSMHFAGTYRVRPRPDGAGFVLRSDEAVGNPAVSDFEYRFELLLDCNHDGTEDTPAQCQEPGYCGADFNADGSVDFFDYDTFVLWYSVGCA
jgi:hypothetical protein